MTQNVLDIGLEITWVVTGAVALLLFALTVALPNRSGPRPGSMGHREEGDEAGHEEIRPDGYIDSFARDIEEAGGGMPPVVKLALPGIFLWWLIYLVIQWTQR